MVQSIHTTIQKRQVKKWQNSIICTLNLNNNGSDQCGNRKKG